MSRHKVITLDKPGCIVACKNGLLAAAYLLAETPEHWHVHARDEKRSKKILKSNPRWQVFVDGHTSGAVEIAMKWQDSK